MTDPRLFRDERGTVTAFVASFTIALLVVAGLVVDGGYTLATRRRAFNEANAAARAGAQAVDESSLRSGAPLRLQPKRAQGLALNHLSSAGLQGTVEIIGDQVLVHVTTTQHMAVLGIVGIGPLTIHAGGAARAVEGVRRGGD